MNNSAREKNSQVPCFTFRLSLTKPGAPHEYKFRGDSIIKINHQNTQCKAHKFQKAGWVSEIKGVPFTHYLISEWLEALLYTANLNKHVLPYNNELGSWVVYL